jgi:hypothetical protein
MVLPNAASPLEAGGVDAAAVEAEAEAEADAEVTAVAVTSHRTRRQSRGLKSETATAAQEELAAILRHISSEEGMVGPHECGCGGPLLVGHLPSGVTGGLYSHKRRV